MNRGFAPHNVKTLWQQEFVYKDTVRKTKRFFI